MVVQGARRDCPGESRWCFILYVKLFKEDFRGRMTGLMDVQIKKGAGNLHAFTVDLSGEEIRTRVRGKIKAVNPRLKVPGYRPGHVPESMIRRNRDLIRSIHQEVLDDLLDSAYSEIIKKSSGTVVHLNPAPVSLETKSEETGLTIEGELEIFEIPADRSPYGVVLSPEEALSVSEEEIATEIERLRIMMSNNFREDLPEAEHIQMSDFVRFKIHFVHPSTGETFDSEQVSEVGGDGVPEAFNQALLGKKRGDRVQTTLPLNVPVSGKGGGTRVETHPAELEVLDIQRRIPLEIGELIARVFPNSEEGEVKTESDLRSDVEKGLLGQKVLGVLRKKREELRKEILATWGVATPEKRMAREYQRLSLSSDADREEYRQIFLWQLVLDQLAEREKIEPDWETVGQEYRQIMQSRGEAPSREVDREALSIAMQGARRIKLEEMMLRQAQFGGQDLFFDEGGYLDKVGMKKFGKKTASVGEHDHDHDHDTHDHGDHDHHDHSGDEGQA